MGRPESEGAKREFLPKTLFREKGEPPLYEQIKTDLLGFINDDVFRPGSTLPTEKQLTAAYKVGRNTLRQALGGLIEDGYLEVFNGRVEGGYTVTEPSQREKKDISSLPRRNKSHHVAGELAGRILEGKYRGAQGLPSDNELMKDFGYSRNTVRTGVDHLIKKGLVKKEEGQGTLVVKKLPPREEIEKTVTLFGREAPELKEPSPPKVKKAVVFERKQLASNYLTRTTGVPQEERPRVLQEVQAEIETLNKEDRIKLNGELLKILANDRIENSQQQHEAAYHLLLVSGLEQIDPGSLRDIYADALKSIPAEGSPNELLDLGLAMSHLLPPYRNSVTTIHSALKIAQRRATYPWTEDTSAKREQLEHALVIQYMSEKTFTQELGALRFNEVTTMLEILEKDPTKERESTALKNLQKMRALDGVQDNSKFSKKALFEILQIKPLSYTKILMGERQLTQEQREKLERKINAPDEQVTIAESAITTALEESAPRKKISGYGKWLQLITEEVGLTQKDLADILGKHILTVNLMINNKSDLAIQDAQLVLLEVEERRRTRKKAMMILEGKKPTEMPISKPVQTITAIRERHKLLNMEIAARHPDFDTNAIIALELGEKEELSQREIVTMIDTFIDLQIPHEDPLLQTLMKAVKYIASTEEALALIHSDTHMAWQRLSKTANRGITEMLAARLEKSVFALESRDFQRKLDIFGGKPLGGLYYSMQTDPRRAGKDTTIFLIERSGSEITPDMVIERLGQPKRFEYARIPDHCYGPILHRVATAREKRVALLGQPDLHEPLNFLNGNNLEGWEKYAQKQKKPNQTSIEFLFQKGDISLTFSDIQYIFFNAARGSEQEARCRWTLVKPQTFYEILEEIAREREIPIETIEDKELHTPLAIINGHTFDGLREYAQRHKQDDESAAHWIKRIAGVI